MSVYAQTGGSDSNNATISMSYVAGPQQVTPGIVTLFPANAKGCAPVDGADERSSGYKGSSSSTPIELSDPQGS